jgi:hypothetical protein
MYLSFVNEGVMIAISSNDKRRKGLLGVAKGLIQ